MKKKLMCNTVFKIQILFCLFVSLSLWFCQPVEASPVTSHDQLNPHVLTIGDNSDYNKAKQQNYYSDGVTPVPLQISKNGTIYLKIYSAHSGAHNIKFFRTANMSDIPVSAGCLTEEVLNPMFYGETYCYLEKGTYYMLLPQDEYKITSYLYPQGSFSLSTGSWTTVYCDYNRPTYLNYRPKDNGYLTISTNTLINNGSLAVITLSNSKGVDLVNTINGYKLNDKFVYAVKKNTSYKIRVSTSNHGQTEFCRIKVNFNKRTEKSGSTKRKAVSISTGKSVTGMVFAEDSAAKADWYKITNSKLQPLYLSFSGSITSGSLKLDVYRSDGKKIKSNFIISSIGDSSVNLISGGSLPKGTYYFRITKSEKRACGIYSLNVKNSM